MAAPSSRTPTHLAKGKIRNGSILYGSTRVISGAPPQIQTLTYRWTHGSHIWSRPSKLPKAYCGLRTRLRCKRRTQRSDAGSPSLGRAPPSDCGRCRENWIDLMTEHVIVTDADGIRTIRMNRPGKKNALTLDMYEAMTAALEGANADDSVHCVLIAGVPGAFTAGND